MINEKTKSRTEAQLGCYTHLIVYSGINTMLFFIWLFAGGFPWFVFPLVGWGIGLLAHFVQVFAFTNIANKD